MNKSTYVNVIIHDKLSNSSFKEEFSTGPDGNGLRIYVGDYENGSKKWLTLIYPSVFRPRDERDIEDAIYNLYPSRNWDVRMAW